MVTFLTPVAFLGTALLAIPILVHLFKPRKVRQTPFSSLRWLHLTQQRLSRRIKWHQVLLFLLRASFLLLLVAALAKPLYIPSDSGSFAERFIILDVSRSMNYRHPDRPSPLELGKQVTADLLAHPRVNDRTAVLLTGSTTQLLGPLTLDAEAYLPTVQAVTGGASETDLSSALEVIRPLLAQRRSDAAVEVYFITDNHQQSWSQGGIAAFAKDLPVPVQVHVVDVGVTSPQNAWIADARLLQSGNPPRRFVDVQVGCVGDADQERTVRLSGLPGLSEQTQAVTVAPGRPARVRFELPDGFDPTDKVAHLSLEPADALPSDDHFYLNLDSRGAVRVLLIEPESSLPESLRPGFYLRTAVEALAVAHNPIELLSRTTTQVTTKEISDSDVIFLADLPELADAQVTALEQRVQAGGGLALFLGPEVNTAFYNTRLHQPLHPGSGLLPAPLGSVTDAGSQPGGPAPWTNVRWNHPLLSRLFDPVLGDLALARCRSYFRFASPLPESDLVLAWVDERTPALVERSLGAGKVILFNSTANDAWSDLPRRKSFVPLIDRLLSYLSGGGIRRSFEVGDVVVLTLPELQAGEKVTVIAPNGGQLAPILTSANGRTTLRLNAVTEPGVYRVQREGGDARGFNLVVQVGRGDSVLTPLEATTLKKWWEPVACDIRSPADLRQELETHQGPNPLWPTLVTLACLMLLAEMFFVHWLCPRVHPAIVGSIVHKGRILASSSQKEATT